MFNAFELVMLLLSMLSSITEENIKAVWLLLEIAFSYDPTTGRFLMTRQRYEAVLQIAAPLSELAACRGVVRTNMANPSFMEAYAILCVILDPIIGSLSAAELKELHHSTEGGFQVLLTPLSMLKSISKNWGRRQITDERFTAWTGSCDTELLDACWPETTSVDTPLNETNTTSRGAREVSETSWTSNITMDDRTTTKILSFDNVTISGTHAASTTSDAWWTTPTLSGGRHESNAPVSLAERAAQTMGMPCPYSSVASSNIPQDPGLTTPVTPPVSTEPAGNLELNSTILPLHILKRKPGICDLRTTVSHDGTIVEQQMVSARSRAQDDFQLALKIMHPNNVLTRSDSLKPHEVSPTKVRSILPAKVDPSMPIITNYEGYHQTFQGTSLYHVLDSLSLVAPSTSVLSDSPKDYNHTQNNVPPKDAWWTAPGPTYTPVQAHTSSHSLLSQQVYGIIPDHILESLSLLAPSTASLSPSTPTTSLPPSPLWTPQSSSESLPFARHVTEWESQLHLPLHSALGDKKQRFNNQTNKSPQTKEATKKAKTFRQRLGALWSH
ncbi:hypothetical protein BDV93DRAFT_557735 [Ceratobasidium sp. AG-I]|nr:hypothetical protein BDV93DRAFT_557735 [Ceratobasidium sp. AG-I]